MPAGEVPEHTDMGKALAAIWGPALQEQMKDLPFLAHVPVDYTRRRYRFKRTRFVLRRINEAWDVLRHGLPEQW